MDTEGLEILRELDPGKSGSVPSGERGVLACETLDPCDPGCLGEGPGVRV